MPLPPVSESSPAPPNKVLFASLPMIVSLNAVPMTFSTSTMVVMDDAPVAVNDPVARFTTTLLTPVRADRSSVSVSRPP